jgi:hypothetical protein
MAYSKQVNPLAEEYLLKAIELEPGEQLVIPQDSITASKSFVYQLHNARKVLQAKTSLAHALIIKQQKDGTEHFIVVEKTKGGISAATIIKNDGTITSFRADASKRRERILTMVIDQCSTEQIEQALDGLDENEREYMEQKKKVVESMK